MTIFKLKQLISERMDLKTDSLGLIYKGREIHLEFYESKTLSEIELGDCSTIKVSYKMNGDIGVFDSLH